MSRPRTPIRIHTAARYLCAQSGWTLSNLQLQSLLYHAQSGSLGAHREAIFHEDFHAGAAGPLNPTLFADLAPFGAGPVLALPNHHESESLRSAPRYVLDRVLLRLGSATALTIMGLAQKTDGAWDRHYTAGNDRVIPKTDMAAEFRMHMARVERKDRQAARVREGVPQGALNGWGTGFGTREDDVCLGM